jgi:hypothetical protein
MRTAAAILTAAPLLTGSARADGVPPPPPHLALLNGSIVEIVADGGGHISVVYVQPRPGLLSIGVLPGSVLLVGRWRGDRLEATAYGWNNLCGFIPYQVSGSVNRDGVLTLVGLAPLVNNSSCRVVGWEWNMASTLAFVPWRF